MDKKSKGILHIQILNLENCRKPVIGDEKGMVDISSLIKDETNRRLTIKDSKSNDTNDSSFLVISAES